MQDIDFMPVEAHFARLVSDLSAPDLKTYNACRNVRVETAFQGRHFIIYRMEGNEPMELDRIFTVDFAADEDEGTTTKLRSRLHGDMIVGYAPVRLFSYPIFVWLPLHAKLRWSATPDNVHKGSLGFPICIRTRSRLPTNMREPNVIYMETGPSFGREFDDNFKG